MAPPKPTGLKDKTLSVEELRRRNAASQSTQQQPSSPALKPTQTGR
ncbi:hypothetical protein ACFYOI_03610 [Streptomyces microflavus]